MPVVQLVARTHIASPSPLVYEQMAPAVADMLMNADLVEHDACGAVLRMNAAHGDPGSGPNRK